MEFPCNDGKGAGLLETLQVALVDTRAFADNKGIETYSDQDNPDLVVLWEKWATRADYEAYLAWRMETGLMDVLAPFMDTSLLRIAPYRLTKTSDDQRVSSEVVGAATVNDTRRFGS